MATFSMTNGCEEVILTSILPNGVFFLMPCKNQQSPELRDITYQMGAAFSSSSSRTYSPEPGAYCCAFSKADGVWYRAVVKEMMDDSHCSVIYPDYGNEEVVPVERMRQREDAFFQYPFLSQTCILGDFVPRDNHWTPILTSVFQKMALNNKFYACFHGYADKTYPPLKTAPQEVSLYQNIGNQNIGNADSVTDVLIKLGYGFPSIPSLLCPTSVPMECRVCCLQPPLHFWLQLEANSIFFDNLRHQIKTKKLANLKSLSSLAHYPGVGCMVPVEEDICRGKILNIDNKMCTVLLVDSGETCTLPINQLYSILPEFYHFSAQATKCALYGVSLPDSPQKINALSRFKQLIDGVTLAANFFVKTSDVHLVLLTNVTTGILISHQLISEGLAISQDGTVSQVDYIALECGDKENVLVTAVETPTTIWGQLIRNTEDVDKLMDRLYETYSTTPPQTIEVLKGDLVAAQFTLDEGWYRAIVRDVNTTENSVKVFYIDYGNNETVETERLRELKPEFLRLPAQAVSFSLHGVDINRQWSSAEVTRLEGLSLNKVLELSVIEKDSSNGSPMVKLVDKMAEDTDIVQLLNLTESQVENLAGYERLYLKAGSKMLVQITYGNSPVDFYCQKLDQGDKFDQLLSDINDYCESGTAELVTMPTVGAAVLAQYDLDRVWYRGEIIEVSEETCKVLFVDYGNVEVIDKKRIFAMLAHFLELPAQAIHCSLQGVSPNVTQEQVDAFESLVQQSLLASIDSLQDDVCFVTLAHSDGTPVVIPSGAIIQPATVKCGVPTPVYISFCEGPESFWCQWQEQATQLQTLASQLNKFYQSQPPGEQQLYMLYVGMLCSARYSTDGSWSRAQVSEVHGNAVTLYFFDYGNYEEYADLPSPDVKQLDDRFLSAPAFAVHCKLAGLGDYPPEITTEFEELVMNDVMIAMFLSTGEDEAVETELKQSGPNGAKILDLIQKSISTASRQSLPQLTLTVGTSVSVLVTAFPNKAEFFCQLLSNDSHLTDFMRDLDSYYSPLGPKEMTCGQLLVGSYACGQFTENDCWYRVIVLEIKSTNDALVMYVDYGNQEVLPLARIKQLMPQFMSYPTQAVRCSLFGVDDNSVATEFSDLLLNKEFHLTAEQALEDGSYRVSLIGIDGIDIVSEASKLGLLVKKSTESGAGVSLPSIVSQVEVGGIVDVVVTHVESPSHFYCNLVQFNDQLAAVTNTIATKGVSASPLLHPEVDMYCLARFSVDGEWYRAHVMSVNSNQVTVQFVDYGNVDNVAISDLKQLEDQKLRTVPAQAIKCGLAHMRPFRGSHWSAASCKFLSDTMLDQMLVGLVQELTPGHAEMILTTTDDKEISALLTAAGHAIKQSQSSLNYKELPLFPNVPYSFYICHVEPPSGVKIWCQLSSCVTELNMLMDQLAAYCATAQPIAAGQVHLGMACCVLYEDGGWYRGLVTNIATDNRFEVLLVDFGNLTAVKASDMREIKEKQMVLPRQALCCLHSGKLTLAFDSEVAGTLQSRTDDGIWNMEVYDRHVDGDVNKKQEKLATIAKYNPFQDRSNLDVFVSFAASPAQFYCQAVNSYNKFNKLTTQMQSHDFVSMTTPPLQEGVFCAAQYIEDSQWYRAKIMSVDSSSMLRVLFVDYGNTEQVNSKDVRLLPAMFADLPAQAVCCSLPTEVAVTINKNTFINAVLEQQFKATLVEILPDQTCAVTLTAPTGEKLFMPSKQITISPLLLSPGAVEVAYVSHVESPTHFYCQLDRNVASLTSMQDLLADVCYKKKCVTQPVNEGMYNAVSYSLDGQWYRAQVTGVHGAQATVRFCDYGNTDTVDVNKSVVSLDDQFSTLPAQGVLCSLGDTSKMTTAQLSALLDTEVTLSVEKVTKNGLHLVQIAANDLVNQPLEVTPLELSVNDHVPVIVTDCVSPQNFYCQDLRAASELEQLLTSLAELETGSVPSEAVIDLHYAACFSEDDQWYRCKVKNVATPQKITVVFVDYGNEDVISVNELRCLTPELCKLPAQAFHCSLFKSPPAKPMDPNSFIDKVLNQEFTANIVDVAPDGFTHIVNLEDESGGIIDGASLIAAYSQPPLSIPKLKVLMDIPLDICVVFAAGPSEIYCQLLKNAEKLDKMMAQLELSISGHVTSPDPGSYCAARYYEDQVWYRAKVLETLNDTVTVQFVDYGNIEVVNINEITPLSPQLADLPAQAIQCSLKQNVMSKHDFSSFDISWVVNATTAIFSSGTQRDQLEAILLDDTGSDVSKSFPVGGATVSTTFSTLPKRPALESGTSVSVVISYVESDDVFYCQLEEWLAEIDELQGLLEQCYEGAGLLSSQSLQPNNYVVAEYSEDGLWYRAKILEVNSDSTATVFFVDYGNKETVTKMSGMPESVLSMPPFAIECHLKKTVDLPDSSFIIDILEVSPNDQYIVQLHAEEEQGDVKASPKYTPVVSPTHVLNETRSLSTESLTIGTPCEVIVSHVEGATMFFVQKLQNSSDLDELMEEMVNHYSNELAVTVIPSKGVICVALFGDDGSWYRARVISSADNEVTLFYLDYGNTDTVPMEMIQPIKDEYCVLPAQAIKCATTVTIDDDEFIETILNIECIVTATKITAGNTHFVEMKTMDGNPLSVTTATEISDGASVVDDLSKADDIIKPQQLAVSSRVPVVVTHVTSPSSFWCRPLYSYEQLDSIMATMADYYNEHVKPISSVTAGTIVAAQYSEDESWYRAKVLSVNNDTVSVFFVDYGNGEVVTMEKIQPINDQFVSLPAQAIHCSISGDTQRTYSSDLVATFIETIYEQEGTIVVQQVREDGLHIVQLEKSGELLDHLFTPTPDNEATNLDDVPSSETIPVDYQYPTIQLDEGNEVDVYISYVEGPASFFCQPLNLGGDLESMMQQLESAMQEPHPLPAAPVGQVCTTKYSQDGVWYRAVVTKDSKDGDKTVTVNFVDYGNSEVTTIENLACLPKEFLVLPAQAIQCSCVDSGIENFPDSVVQQFRELICEGEQYTITIEQLLGYGKYYVLVSNGEGEVNVTELLQDTDIGTTNVVSTVPPTADTSEDTPEVAMTAEEAQEEEMVDRLLKMPIMQHQQVPREDAEVSSNGSFATPDELQVPFQLSLTPREVFMGTISHVENPSLFYVQRSDCANELLTLETDIKEHCHDNPTFEREVWSAGSFVLAMSSTEEGHWRRAEVKEVFLDGKCEVFFVDYGNMATCSTTDSLRPCPENCNALPMQAIVCSLAHVPRREEPWPAYYKELMEEFARDKELRISVAVPGSQGMRPTVVVEATGSGAELSQKVLEKLQAECEAGSSNLSLAEEEEDNDYLEPLAEDDKAPPVAFTDQLHPGTKLKALPVQLHNGVTMEDSDEDQDLDELQNWLGFDASDYHKVPLTVNETITFTRLHGKTTDNLIGCLHSEEWEGLMKEISSYASSCPQIECIDDVIPGKPIIACHDEIWHRAHVIVIDHASLLTVHLPDVLSIVKIALSDVRPMKSEFMSLPSQAVHCALIGVEPLEYEWGKNSRNVLRVLTNLKRPLNCIIMDVEPTKIVACLDDEVLWTEVFVACCVSRVLAELEASSVLLEHEQ